MLSFTREYTDGQYEFMASKFLEGNIVVLQNKLTGVVLKQYFTEDDETAIALFESMLMCHRERGNEALEKYTSKEHISEELNGRIIKKVE